MNEERHAEEVVLVKAAIQDVAPRGLTPNDTAAIGRMCERETFINAAIVRMLCNDNARLRALIGPLGGSLAYRCPWCEVDPEASNHLPTCPAFTESGEVK